jgi:hypothetical protein
MPNPVFIETSKGCVNLSLVREIVDAGKHVRFWFDTEHHVEIPQDEWLSVRGRILHLFVMET